MRKSHVHPYQGPHGATKFHHLSRPYEEDPKNPRSPRSQSVAPKLSKRKTHRLDLAAAKSKAKSSKLKAELELKCSARSVHSVLSRYAFLQYSKMEKALPRTAAHKSALQQWTSEMMTTQQYWKVDIFSDERSSTLTARTVFASTGANFVVQRSRPSGGNKETATSWWGLLVGRKRASWRFFSAAKPLLTLSTPLKNIYFPSPT